MARKNETTEEGEGCLELLPENLINGISILDEINKCMSKNKPAKRVFAAGGVYK